MDAIQAVEKTSKITKDTEVECARVKLFVPK